MTRTSVIVLFNGIKDEVKIIFNNYIDIIRVNTVLLIFSHLRIK